MMKQLPTFLAAQTLFHACGKACNMCSMLRTDTFNPAARVKPSPPTPAQGTILSLHVGIVVVVHHRSLLSQTQKTVITLTACAGRLVIYWVPHSGWNNPKLENLATPIRIILAKSLKKLVMTLRNIELLSSSVSFSFTSRHFLAFLKCYKMGKT